ncbi:S41 family peptidase [Henriciella sp. AS95]|uniref:S41 family peptidase n=1 Tax=Henriciella sp. AS95 TaxID=3135782 RepID=UPI003179C2D5
MIGRFMKAAFAAAALAASVPGFADEAALSQPESDFEAFWALYDQNYALFEIKHIDWDALYHIYRPQVTADTGRDELFNIFTAMTRLLNDVHVTVEDQTSGRFSRSGGRSLGTGPFETGEFSIRLIESDYIEGELESRANGAMAFGWLPEGIGYLRIASFKYPDTSSGTMDQLMQRFVDARGIIIDVRQNGGGSDRISEDIVSRFALHPHDYMRVSERVPDTDDGEGFNAAVTWSVPAKGSAWSGRPVAVLTDSRTISAAENFVIAMKTLPHATIIGDTTAGVMADAHRMPAGEGWRFGVPVNVMRDIHGVSWEGIGIVPDYWIRNSAADLNDGEDRVLSFALDFMQAASSVGPRTRVIRPPNREGG